MTVAVAAVSAGLGWAVARWSGPSGTVRYRALMLASFLAFLTLGSSTLVPRARAWQQERDVEALLRSVPLFVAVLEDEPSLREPLRAHLLKAVRESGRGEAVLMGQRLLSPHLWRYVPRASDDDALGLGRALVATLSDLQARDPQQCYRFLFPAVAGPAGNRTSARDEGVLAALRAVVTSARSGTAPPLDRRTAGKELAPGIRPAARATRERRRCAPQRAGPGRRPRPGVRDDDRALLGARRPAARVGGAHPAPRAGPRGADRRLAPSRDRSLNAGGGLSPSSPSRPRGPAPLARARCRRAASPASRPAASSTTRGWRSRSRRADGRSGPRRWPSG